METEKKFWQSKTKMGALLMGLSAVLATMGAYISGAVDAGATVNALIIQVGAVLAVFGVRDLPVINK